MKVLVIEDDAAVSSLIEFALEGHAVGVVSAASPDELIGVLEQEGPFDAALVDLSPFEEDTSDALKLLETASSNGASLILISGLVTTVPPELEGCIAGWVRKPFEMAEVVDALRQIHRPPVAPAEE
jgi:DNA-binding response OmpR family regulator